MKRFQSIPSLVIVAILSFGTLAMADSHQKAKDVKVQKMENKWQPYSEEAFKKAKMEGKTVVLDFRASWCSTCKKQKPILEALLKEKDFESVTGFVVDYDNSKALKRKLKVNRQSTLIVFKGNKEVDRKIGITNKDKIRSFIASGV